jgi:hypothetical protein
MEENIKGERQGENSKIKGKTGKILKENERTQVKWGENKGNGKHEQKVLPHPEGRNVTFRRYIIFGTK